VLTRWLDPDPDLEQRRRESVDWGLRDALLALIVAQVVGVFVGAAILSVAGYTTQDELDLAPLWLLLVLQVPLWIGYGGVTLWASSRKGHGPEVDLGWRFTRLDVPFGLATGIGLQLVALPILYIPIRLLFPDLDVSEAARDLTDRATGPAAVVALVLIVGVGAPIVEELFFRGLLLRSLDHRFGSLTAILGSSVVFGAVHQQLPQFPALVLVGVVTAVITLRSGRLGPAIWTHVGFNMTTVVALLAYE
jgi:uncharacterized protein